MRSFDILRTVATSQLVLASNIAPRAEICKYTDNLYPAAILTSLVAWSEALTKAENFVSNLTLSEKIGLVSGGYLGPSLACVGSIGPISRQGFDGLCYSDGPNGVARSDGVSVFPSGITAAATWDRELIYKRGVAIGEEFRAKGAHVILGYVYRLSCQHGLLTIGQARCRPYGPSCPWWT